MAWEGREESHCCRGAAEDEVDPTGDLEGPSALFHLETGELGFTPLIHLPLHPAPPQWSVDVRCPQEGVWPWARPSLSSWEPSILTILTDSWELSIFLAVGDGLHECWSGAIWVPHHSHQYRYHYPFYRRKQRLLEFNSLPKVTQRHGGPAWTLCSLI